MPFTPGRGPPAVADLRELAASPDAHGEGLRPGRPGAAGRSRPVAGSACRPRRPGSATSCGRSWPTCSPPALPRCGP